MTFSKLRADELRTNESFRAKTHAEHHREATPLEDLPIDMVADFPVCDAHHLLHIGLMKKFLKGWSTGSFGFDTKWSKQTINEISNFLVNCKLPVEIHRRMRKLMEMPRWKATEYRTFLMYVGVVVLKKYLPRFYYDHFLLFYCSIVIMNNQFFIDRQLMTVAEDMIRDFLLIFRQKYGAHHFSSNLHNLSHIVDEVKRFGPLQNFDAYKFENKLQDIKKMIRLGNNQLAQLRKPIIEREGLKDKKNSGAAIINPIIISHHKYPFR